MRVIHLLRKPTSERTVTANVVKHGTGGLNIDASRIGTHGETLSCSTADPYHAKDGSQRTWNPTSTRGVEREQHVAGRWPANMIFQHLDGCRRRENICEPGCPVAALEEQTDDLQSGHRPNRGASRFFKQIGGKTDG